MINHIGALTYNNCVWTPCASCEQTDIPVLKETGMCEPCTLGEADSYFGYLFANWEKAPTETLEKIVLRTLNLLCECEAMKEDPETGELIPNSMVCELVHFNLETQERLQQLLDILEEKL